MRKGFLALTLIMALSISLGKVEAQMSSPPSQSVQPAPLNIRGGPFRPDKAFAEMAYQAISSYIAGIKNGTFTSTLSQHALEDLPVAGKPDLDARGFWRLGVWLLEVRGGQLALTFRPAQPEPRFEYIATLDTTHNTVRVTNLAIGQLRPRRPAP